MSAVLLPPPFPFLLLLLGFWSSQALLAACTNVTVKMIVPDCGPYYGGTVVSVFGTGFSGEMQCLFNDVEAPATVESEERLSCTAKPGSLGKVSFSLKNSDGETVQTDHNYEYYVDPTISGYKPHKASLNKAVKVSIHGSFESTKSYTCMFNNSNGSANVTTGTLSADKGTITCYTPKWGVHEQVQLSVSLNGQQYSSPVPFTFKNDIVKVNNTLLIVLGAVLLVVVVAIALVMVWIRHRHYIAGYDKIKEGNAEVDLSEIKYGNVIGRGTFGEVFKGTWRGAIVAVKKLNSSQMSEEFVKEYEREVYLMRTLRAPNILQFLGSTFNPPDICIIMEYMSRGSLYSILHDDTCALEWPLLLHMLADTAKGMTYLHTCKPPVIHRDLKSHNLLVDEFWRVKVSDFGLSTVFEQTDQTMAAYGTPCWTAPEVLRSLHYTVKADVYSFAIVMWECVTRADPYENMLPYKVIYAVGNKGLRPQVPAWVPQQYANLMRSCWDDDMDMRPEFPAILDEIEEMSQLKWAGQPNPESNQRRENDSSSSSEGGNGAKDVKVSANESNDKPKEQVVKSAESPIKETIVPTTPLSSKVKQAQTSQSKITNNNKQDQQFIPKLDGNRANEKLPLLIGQYGDSYTVRINGTEIHDSDDDDSSERSTSFHSSDEDSDDDYY